MKNSDTQKYIALVIIGMIVAGLGTWFIVGGGTETIVVSDDEPIAPWKTKIVPLDIIVSNLFTGEDVSATAKVYDKKPEDWGNARGTFDEASEYTSYTADNGTIYVNKEMPGTYYAVINATSYNTEFVTLTIPDGTGMGDFSDYTLAPDSVIVEMTSVGTITEKDYALTLTNDTSKLIKETLLLPVAENTEFRGWKVIVTDTEGFSLDTDGDGIYDEGIKSYIVSVAGIEKIVFDTSKSIDEFDSNDEFTFSIEGVNVMDEDNIEVYIEILAITGDYTGANDEVWGEGEGVLSYIHIYDETGTLRATTDVTA